MRLKERGRYTVINPDNDKSEKMKKIKEEEGGEGSGGYTDGFYSSDSDTFVP
mgnify:CR=1 FL=1